MDLTLKLLDEDEIRGYVSRWQSFFWRRNMMALQEKSVSATKQLDWRSERMDGPSWMCHHKKYVSFCVFWGWSVGAEWEDQRKSLSVQSLDKLENSFCLKKKLRWCSLCVFQEPRESWLLYSNPRWMWFGCQITAQVCDGTTDYQAEITREREKRLKIWEYFLNTRKANTGLWHSNSICASERAGPSRVRHFSEHPNTSKTNAQEATTQMESEEPADEKKFAKTENGGEFWVAS